MKFATKPIQHYPPHLRHVATLPWEINKFFAAVEESTNKLHFYASNFVIHPQILIFSVFKIVILFSYGLQIKFSTSLFFYLFTFESICGIENSSQQTSLQCLSTINMVFTDEDEILIKSLYSRG